MAKSLSWDERAREVGKWQRAMKEPGLPASERGILVGAFRSAWEDAYPAMFRENVHAVRDGDPAAVELAIEFMQADPMFFRSGYLKSALAKALKKPALTERQRDRLRDALVRIVASRDGREYRDLRRLARRLDEPVFRGRLVEIAHGSDGEAARRAIWMLDGMDA